jgi:hypothetical protein
MMSAIVTAAGSCDLFTAPPRDDGTRVTSGGIEGVSISLEFPGPASRAVLTTGTVDTILAQAYTSGWPSSIAYDSRDEPRRFRYSSSHPAVASVDLDGIVTLNTPGTTTLSAFTAGKTSFPLVLEVEPRARELRMTPAAFDVAVGDTVSVNVTARNEAGADVAGVHFYVSTDEAYWTVLGRPVDMYGSVKTPRLVRFRANSPGRVVVSANSWNDRAPDRPASASGTVEVRAR